MNIKGKKGITLIALVITIVILIILAGVVISLSFGENSLLNRAKEARQKYEIAEAKEYIEMKIDECIIDKDGNASLQDIVDYLAEDSNVTYYVALEEIAVVAGEVDIGTPKEIYVVYNRYQFKIEENKNVEFISIVDVDLEGQVTIEANVQEYLGKNEEGNYTARVLLKATGEAKIVKLEIQNSDGTMLELLPDGLTTVGKDMTIEFDKEYKVILTTENGHKYTKKIIERAEETIMTAEELASFRDRVNSGLTYEGKIVKIGADIDLSTVCGENVNGKEISWEPIGYYNSADEYCYFEGTFDGNYHSISNLYINSDEDKDVALFRVVYGIIKNVIIKDVDIYNNKDDIKYTSVGSIVAINRGTIEKCAIINGKIKYEGNVTIENYFRAGSIAGYNYGIIDSCYNGAEVTCINNNTNSNVRAMAGGITGANSEGKAKTINCYNKGTVKVVGGSASCAGGIVGLNANGAITENSYNYGSINQTGNALIGGVVGRNKSNSTGIITNCYCTQNTKYSYYETSGTSSGKTVGRVSSETLKSYTTILGDAFIDDIQNEDGTWKYNNGYPILKWQLNIENDNNTLDKQYLIKDGTVLMNMTNANIASVTQNEGYIQVLTNNVKNRAAYYTNSAIDLSNYSNIKIDIEVISKTESTLSALCCSFFSEITNLDDDKWIECIDILRDTTSLSRKIVTIDISQINDKCIVAFLKNATVPESQVRYNLYNMWLEK